MRGSRSQADARFVNPPPQQTKRGTSVSSRIASATIASAAEPQLRFVTIGQGPLEEQLRTELARTALGDRFRMLGFHPDPAAVVAGADIFVLASTHEGLPIALLEAMALGVPPVATDVGGVAEVVVFDPESRIGKPEEESAKVVAFARSVDAAVVGLGT